MKTIYKDISARITDQVTAVAWVDFDLGQLDTEMPPVSFPCALIGFTSGEYLPLGMDTTTGTVNVEITLAFQLRERTHSKANSTYRDEALGHMDTVDAVRIALTGLQGSTFGKLSYAGFQNDRRADLRVWRLRFTCEHFPAAPANTYVDWPGNAPVGFCVHPDIEQGGD